MRFSGVIWFDIFNFRADVTHKINNKHWQGDFVFFAMVPRPELILKNWTVTCRCTPVITHIKFDWRNEKSIRLKRFASPKSRIQLIVFGEFISDIFRALCVFFNNIHISLRVSPKYTDVLHWSEQWKNSLTYFAQFQLQSEVKCVENAMCLALRRKDRRKREKASQAAFIQLLALFRFFFFYFIVRFEKQNIQLIRWTCTAE